MTGSATPTGYTMPADSISRRVEALLRARLELEVRRLVLRVLRRLIERTPIGIGINAGRLRRSWKIGVNEINAAISLGTIEDAPALPAWKLGDIIYITNSLPYAIGIEYGHSAQAPTGIVFVTVAEILTGTLSFTEGGAGQ